MKIRSLIPEDQVLKHLELCKVSYAKDFDPEDQVLKQGHVNQRQMTQENILHRCWTRQVLL